MTETIPTNLEELFAYNKYIAEDKLIKLRYFDQNKFNCTHNPKQGCLTFDRFQKDANTYDLALVNEKNHDIEYYSGDFDDHSDLSSNLKQVFDAWSQYQNYDIDYSQIKIVNYDILSDNI